jgi:hypothetical protein
MAGKLGENEHQAKVKEGLESKKTAEGEIKPLLRGCESGSYDDHGYGAGKQAPDPGQNPECYRTVKTEEAKHLFYYCVHVNAAPET